MKKLERKMSKRKKASTERVEPKHLNNETVRVPISPKTSQKKASTAGVKTSKALSAPGAKKYADLQKEPAKGTSIFPPPIAAMSKTSHKTNYQSAEARVTLFGTKVKYQESQGFSPSLTKSAELGESPEPHNATTKTCASDNSLPHSLNGSLTTRYTPGSSRKRPRLPDSKNALKP
jgi:hypothetical protein